MRISIFLEKCRTTNGTKRCWFSSQYSSRSLEHPSRKQDQRFATSVSAKKRATACPKSTVLRGRNWRNPESGSPPLVCDTIETGLFVGRTTNTDPPMANQASNQEHHAAKRLDSRSSMPAASEKLRFRGPAAILGMGAARTGRLLQRVYQSKNLS